MNLRDLIFSQQSNAPSSSLAAEENNLGEVGSSFPLTQTSVDDDFLLPSFQDPLQASPFSFSQSQSQSQKSRTRLSHDNSSYYQNLIQENEEEEPVLSQLRWQDRYQESEAEGDEDSDENHPKTKTKKGRSKKVFNPKGMRKRGSKYFSRTPNPDNAGRFYQTSPEFTFSSSLSYNGVGLQEYSLNELSFVKFPQLEESFFSFQRKLIRELLLRCYHAKDVDGFIQILNVLIDKQQIELSEIALFFELLRYSSYRIPILTKIGNHLFSKQFMHRIHYPKHKSLLFCLLEILLQEILFTSCSTTPSSSSPSSFAGYDSAGIVRVGGLLSGVKQFVASCQEFPSMKSVSLLWAIDAVILCHQMLHKTQLLLQQFHVLHEITAGLVLADPLSFSAVSRVLVFFESAVPFKKYLPHRQEAKALLREASNCFHFVMKDQQSLYWIEMQELYLGFLLGKNDHHRALQFLKDLEKRYLPPVAIKAEEEEKDKEGENEPSSSSERKQSVRELIYRKSRFLRLLIKYLLNYEHSIAVTAGKKEEVRTMCSEMFLFCLQCDLHQSDSNSDDCDGCVMSGGNKLGIAWYLFRSSNLSRNDFIRLVCDYLEVHPPRDHENENENQNQNDSHDDHSRHYPSSSYDYRHLLAWKMLVIALRPLPSEKRVKRGDAVSMDCEAQAFVRNAVLANQLFANQTAPSNPSTNPSLPLPLPTPLLSKPSPALSSSSPLSSRKDWIYSLLAGNMLDNCYSTVLPFKYEKIITLLLNESEITVANEAPKTISTNNPTNSTSSSSSSSCHSSDHSKLTVIPIESMKLALSRHSDEIEKEKQSERRLIDVLQENLLNIASRDDLSVRSVFSDNMSQSQATAISQMSQMSQISQSNLNKQ